MFSIDANDNETTTCFCVSISKHATMMQNEDDSNRCNAIVLYLPFVFFSFALISFKLQPTPPPPPSSLSSSALSSAANPSTTTRRSKLYTSISKIIGFRGNMAATDGQIILAASRFGDIPPVYLRLVTIHFVITL